MKAEHNVPIDPSLRLDAFCCLHRKSNVWRLYVWPGQRPPVLDEVLDQSGEAHPVQLDFDDMDAYLASQDASVEKRWSRFGDVELTAYGHSAYVLATWLAISVASGVRSGSVL